MFVNTDLCIVGVYLHSVFVEGIERFVTEANLDLVQRGTWRGFPEILQAFA